MNQKVAAVIVLAEMQKTADRLGQIVESLCAEYEVDKSFMGIHTDHEVLCCEINRLMDNVMMLGLREPRF